MLTPVTPLALTRYVLHSHLDYVKFATPNKIDLPRLVGKPKWGAGAHYKELTVHDASAADIAALVSRLPRAQVLEVEVAVDFLPLNPKSDDERDLLLAEAYRYLAWRLYPYKAPYMHMRRTRLFRPRWHKIMCFSYRTPELDDQLLYGLRDDGPAQVKVYRKTVDQGRELPVANRLVRVEVKLKREACELLGLRTLEDFEAYPFRSALSAYFCLVRQPAATAARSRRKLLAHVHRRLATSRTAEAIEAWSRNGVQCAREVAGIRFRRDAAANRRIGKALQNLQGRFARKEKGRRHSKQVGVSHSGSGACV